MVVTRDWSNLATVVYRRTYSRKDTGPFETWPQTVDRYVGGNVRGMDVPEAEIQALKQLGYERKGTPAGRGIWFSGAPAHERIGGAACNNCYFLTADDWYNFVRAQDLLMLGGGVGLSVEHRFTTQLPKVQKGVNIVHIASRDADFIVPDSREGWCELLRRVLESYFVNGLSFSFSTVCLRGRGEPIHGFGGVASGPGPLIGLVSDIAKILQPRAGKHVRPLDAADLICATADMVVSGNVRRSAIIILGDSFDKEYLKAKRWSLGTIPSWRANANFSVVCDEIDDLHPSFWKTYEDGEPFGLINRKNIQRFGRMGELKEDTAVGVNPCVPGYTLILTDQGYKPIETLVGQTVNVWNGFEWSEVVPRETGTNQPLVDVLLSSGQSLGCTPAHEWVVATGYKGFTFRVPAGSLESGMRLLKAQYPVVNVGVPMPHAYTQGFIAADGMDEYRCFHVYSTKYMCIDRLEFKHQSAPDDTGRIRLSTSFEPELKTFVPLGGDVKARVEWLAGLLDGDGCVLKEGGSQISSVDLYFLCNVQLMLTTLGVASKVTLMHEAALRNLPDGRGGQKLYPCQTSYRLLVGACEMQALVALGLHCERLKFEGFTPQRNAGRFVTVVDVVDAGVADKVYCFTEPKRHLGCFEGIVTGQCAEATLECAEPCNLAEIPLMNLNGVEEFENAARLLFRYTKRVTMQKYHDPKLDEVVKRNRRVGIGITGCLGSSLFNPQDMDRVYAAIQEENRVYSKQMGVPESIRTTVVKPSGTTSKVLDQGGYEGIHPAYSRHIIQRVRFSAEDSLIPLLRAAGHHIEPVINFDGSLNQNTLVVDFYVKAPDGSPVSDENFDTWKQLDVLKLAQKHWADQAVSVTIYYKKEDIPKLKEWLAVNWCGLKTISFLCHNDHGFKQAPKEAISASEFEKLSKKVKPISLDQLDGGGDMLEGLECPGGVCPVR